MAKGISSGIGTPKRSDTSKQIDQMLRSWKDLKNRLDIILVANNIMKGNDLRQKCMQLDNMTIDERRTYIVENWGPLYLEKSQPLLQQLEVLEAHIGKHSKE